MHDELKVGHIDPEKLYDSGLAYFAAKDAIKSAGISVKDIDVVLYCSSTPDMLLQQQSGKIATALGIEGAFVQDIIAGCTGFFDGVFLADKLIKSGEVKTALVTGSNMISNYARWFYNGKNSGFKISYGHPGFYSAVIFGDGAGAAVLTPTKAGGILSNVIGADGEQNEVLIVRGGGSKRPFSQQIIDEGLHYLEMEGNPVFKFAVRILGKASIQALKKAGLTRDDIDFLIPHQANIRIIDAE